MVLLRLFGVVLFRDFHGLVSYQLSVLTGLAQRFIVIKHCKVTGTRFHILLTNY